MISLAAVEEVHASSITTGQFNPHPVTPMDVAVFYAWKNECDGTRTPMFELVKALPGYPVGSVLTLKKIHELLFPPSKR